MNVFTSVPSFPATPCVLALGCFDGVHLGHVAVIRRARQLAEEQNLPCAVLCFREPPKNLFSPCAVPLLTTPDEKAIAIEALGVSLLFSIPFDRRMAETSAEDFFSLLCDTLSARHVVCGFNFTFGAGGLGNASLLASLCREHGVGLTVVPPTRMEEEAVSSSRIRTCLEMGEVSQAARLLGRPYSLSAEVIHGQHLARKLGFCTANQLFPEGKVIPKHGVYVIRARHGDRTFGGIANVGMRPTVRGTLLCCETHLFDFAGDLYGSELTVEFLEFLREERPFDSLAALTAQIEKDVEKALAYCRSLSL